MYKAMKMSKEAFGLKVRDIFWLNASRFFKSYVFGAYMTGSEM